MSLQDEVVQEIRQRRAGWLVDRADLQRKIDEVQEKIDEANEMLVRLTVQDAPEPPSTEPVSSPPSPAVPSPVPVPLPEPEPRDQPTAQPGTPTSVTEMRGKGGQVPSRAGIPLENWLGVIRRDFRDREFTSLELVSAMPGLDPSKDAHRQAAREVLRRLPEVGQVTTGRDQRFRLKSTVQICGPGALAAAQAAWDETNGAGEETGGSSHPPRGVPVPGTGRSHAVNGIPKDLLRIIQPALDAGWTPSVTGKEKVKVTHPTQHTRFFRVPTTPSDYRTAQNLRAEMRGVSAPGV